MTLFTATKAQQDHHPLLQPTDSHHLISEHDNDVTGRPSEPVPQALPCCRFEKLRVQGALRYLRANQKLQLPRMMWWLKVTGCAPSSHEVRGGVENGRSSRTLPYQRYPPTKSSRTRELGCARARVLWSSTTSKKGPVRTFLPCAAVWCLITPPAGRISKR